MICPRCKKREASVIVTQMINGQKKEYCICPHCAAELGLIHGVMMNMSDFISDFVGKGVSAGEDITCPVCGTTLTEFTKNSMLGCGSCYEAMAPQLDAVMKKMHGNTTHSGKCPKSHRSAATLKHKITQMKDEIAAAVQNEDYERAAFLRDEIKRLSAESERGE